MRLLHVSDLHAVRPWFDWVAQAAPAYSAVCLTGDLLDLRQAEHAPVDEQIRWVSDWLRRFPAIPLFVCSGNHDWWLAERATDPYAEARWLRQTRRPGLYLDRTEKVIAGRRFVCVPWLGSPPLRLGPEPVVLLAHAPPVGVAVACTKNGEDGGDFEVAAAAESLPCHSVVLSGHIHAPKNWYAQLGRAWCFNPGLAPRAKVPRHIVIDFDRGVAQFHSGAGRVKTQSLAA